MPIESATLISDLVVTNPLIDEPVKEGSDHLRLLKTVIKNTFPNVTGVVTATHTALNESTGLAARVTTVEANRLRNDTSGTVAGSLNVTGLISQGGNVLLPAGVICMWSGVVASIPAGWALCDGTLGTPDLRDRFVIGAGGLLSPGSTVGTNSLSFTTGISGTHTHTAADAGAHAHTASSNVMGAHHHGTLTGYTGLTVNDIPAHTHTLTLNVRSGNNPGSLTDAGFGGDGTLTGDAVATTGATGGGTPHTHTISTDGDHAHVITVDVAAAHAHAISTDGSHTHTATIDNRPASYALAFIMKV